jgi:hypothetical protein
MSSDSDSSDSSDSPEIVLQSPRTFKKKKAAEAKRIQQTRKAAFLKPKSSNRTESNEELLGHYRAYRRESPVFKIKRKMKFVTFGKPMQTYLPSSVLLLVNMHGRTKEPFLSPMNVFRYIGSDFGTCNFNPVFTLTDRDLMKTGYSENSTWNSAGALIEHNLRTRMMLARKITDERYDDFIPDFSNLYLEPEEYDKYLRNLPEYLKYKESQTHTTPKFIKKGLPMFNKMYSMYGPDGKESHETHSIFVRANLPHNRLAEDFFFEIQVEETTLQEILAVLARKGVTDVTLFDFSCQGDTRSPIHRTRYGGH